MPTKYRLTPGTILHADKSARLGLDAGSTVRDLTRSTGAEDEHITVLLCFNYQDNYQLINLIKICIN